MEELGDSDGTADGNVFDVSGSDFVSVAATRESSESVEDGDCLLRKDGDLYAAAYGVSYGTGKSEYG